MVLRRLARAVLLCAVILGAWGGQVPETTDCIVAYELITPDGQTFDLSGFGDTGWRIGTGASVQGHEGFGLPPVRHITQDVYQQPGALLQDIKVESRMVILTESVWATNRTRKDLHRARAELLDALRWDRGERAEASVLRYTVDGESFDLNVVYAGMAESRQGRDGVNEILSIRLMAHDPVWWDDEESDLVLDWQDDLGVLYIAAKLDGQWDNLGPPAAVAVGPNGGRIIYAIAEDPATGNIYVGGDFDNWDNLGAGVGECIVMWDGTNWNAVGGSLNDIVLGLQFAPDGTMYVCGEFTNGGGGAGPAAQSYIVQYDPDTNTYTDVGGGAGAGAVTTVYDAVIGHDGTLYIGGIFTNWAGRGSPAGDYIVQLALGGAWATVGGGLNGAVYEMAIALDGNLWVVGGFTQTGGAAPLSRVGEWDVAGAAWIEPLGGVDQAARGVKVAQDGTVYVCGLFTLANPGADQITVNYVTSWNGVAWSPLGAGLDNNAYYIVIGNDDTVYVSGQFTQAGPLTVADRVARWNGFSWAHLDVDLPGTPLVRSMLVSAANELYLGFDTQGTAEVAGVTAVTNTGSALSYPIIEVKNEGLLQTIINETLGHELLFDYQILDGEIVTIDMTFGQKTITSSWRGNVLGELLSNSDLGIFKLEGAPRAAYEDVDGANLISVFITDADPRESGDNNNQLSDWANITGISQDNTDLGKLYVNIVNVGGPPWRVDIFMDSGKAVADLVGHTANYAGAGAQVIIEDNDSGLGGSITIDALVAADTDIEVYFTIVTIFWHNKWWSADEAVA